MIKQPRTFGAPGHSLNIMRSNSEKRAIEIVAHGFGLALLPHSASSLSRTGVIFKPVSDRYLKIETALFARRDLEQGALKHFVRFLAERLQGVKPIGQ